MSIPNFRIVDETLVPDEFWTHCCAGLSNDCYCLGIAWVDWDKLTVAMADPNVEIPGIERDMV